MKRFPGNILATMAVLLTGSEVFGQIQQVGHRNCQQGGYIGYQSCDWNGCRTGRGIGHCWTDSCLNDTCIGRYHASKAFPDAGWAAPVRLPVNYDGVWYGNYHPQAFYGNPGGAFIANYPVVYQPTDTTQLGYYYHKVPTWQSRPGMIPPTPRPSDFHARMGLSDRCGRAGGYNGASCQACQSNGYATSGPQFTVPNGGQVVRPMAQKKQGLLGGFRFASLTEILD